MQHTAHLTQPQTNLLKEQVQYQNSLIEEHARLREQIDKIDAALKEQKGKVDGILTAYAAAFGFDTEQRIQVNADLTTMTGELSEGGTEVE